MELLKPYSNRSGNKDGLTQGDTIAQLSPLAFLRSGYYYYSNGSLGNRTTYGFYWSGRFYSVTTSYRLLFGSTYLDPQYGDNRGNGFAVRCLARYAIILLMTKPKLGKIIGPVNPYFRPHEWNIVNILLENGYDIEFIPEQL